MKSKIDAFLMGIAFLMFMYLVIAWVTFQVNNPICNEMAFYTHFLDVMQFKTLPEFQTMRK